MFAAVDVFYDEAQSRARAACVIFPDALGDRITEELVVPVSPIAAYAPGAFYRRELPCIEAVVGSRAAGLELLFVDGYVYLNEDERPGLGWHVHQSLGVPVIGVAKKRFADAEKFSDVVLRGGSQQPLYVTQVGYRGSAADLVRQMHGAHRIPTVLRRADQLARGNDMPKG
ncbi:MAG TPA: endonuclease V [Pirellulales bacterium]|nr:endonuclease V [Pirellulales bacterium]